MNSLTGYFLIWLFYTGDKISVPTREHGFDVPGWYGVNEGVHIQHDYRDSEAVGVSFHRAGVGVIPLDTNTLFLILREILAAEAKGHRGQEALRKWGQSTSIRLQRQKRFNFDLCYADTHSKDSDFGVESISPGHAQHVGQVQSKVYEPTASCGQVGFGKESADEETLHDGGSGKRREEEKHHRRVAVRQDVAPLGKKRRRVEKPSELKQLPDWRCCCCCLTLSRAMRSPAETRKGTRLLINQLSHRVPVPRPMILMVSFSLASFSYTIPLMIMATE